MSQRIAAPLFCLLTLAACNRNGANELDAPMPSIMNDVDSVPALPPSLIEIPLSYDLSPILAQLEKAVPRTFGDLEKKQDIPGNKRAHFAFAAEREPFTVSLDGTTARMRAVIHYAGRGWYNAPVAPEVSGSCGTGDQRPRAVIELASDLRLTKQWQLRGSTRINRVAAMTEEARDQCRVTFIRFDVTEKVINAARDMLQSQTRAIDAQIASLDLRSTFEGLWQTLSTPIRLTDSVWLQINPIEVRQGEITGAKRRLNALIGLVAAPRVVTGSKPPVETKPLPPLRSDSVGDGFHILIEASLDYALASQLMTKELKGKRFQRGDRHIEIKKVRIFGIGAGKVALELRFAGSTGGRVFFVGSPKYDPVADQLVVPDLDYDLASASALVRGLAWVGQEEIRDYLREHAHWPVGGLINQARTALLDGLNRDLAPGVRLSGKVDQISALGVNASGRSIVVRAHAIGEAKLEIRPKKPG